MKETRKIFILQGEHSEVTAVMNKCDFKGLVRISGSFTKADILNVFNSNKSVLCTELSPILHEFPAIVINVCENNIPATNIICLSKGNIIEQFQKIAEFSNCDIGDHRSNSSSSTGVFSTDDCAYCRFLNGINPHKHNTFYRSKNFIVIATLGEFITGYLLIIPIRHVTSFAELNDEEFSEFQEVLSDVKEILSLTYHTSKFLVWENGTGNGGLGKAKDSLVHAHLHIAPSNLTAENIKEISRFPFTDISTPDIRKYGEHSYLLLQDGENDWKIQKSNSLYIPRQYIRQILADEYNIPGDMWNWRIYGFEDLMKQTYLDVKQALNSNWDLVSVRIRERTAPFMN